MDLKALLDEAAEYAAEDYNLEALLEEAAEHAAERKASSIRKEQALRNLLTSGTSMQPGSKAALIESIRDMLYDRFPDFTDEELDFIINE